jgi:hypothetical protein
VATTGGNETGNHAALLGELSSAIYAFQDDLKRHGVEDRVVGMTYSEFGRRIKSNGSLGTDHGTAQPMIVFGTQVIPGFLGVNPTIGTTASSNTNLEMQTDFRQVYNSLLKDWFSLSDAQLSSVLYQSWPYVAIIKQPGVNYPFAADQILSQNYPNPFSSTTTINFYAKGGETILDYFDSRGRLMGTILQANIPQGASSTIFNGTGMARGIYFYRIRTGGEQQVLSMVKV